MKNSGETIVTRGSMGKLYGLPQSYTDWAILVSDNRAITSQFNAGDLPFVKQAAAETDTQYCVVHKVLRRLAF